MRGGQGVVFSTREFANSEEHKAVEYCAKDGTLSLRSSRLFLFADVILALVTYWYGGTWLSDAARLPAVCLLLLIAYLLASHVREERITIISGLGVELKTYYSLCMCKTRFLGDGSIQGILVHESIRGSRVHYSLAFVIHADKRLMLCFRHVYPGLVSLRVVYDRLTRDRCGFEQQAK